MSRELGGFDPQETYSAAAEDYDRASQQYWEFLSTRTVERLGLRPGQSVLDAACGTGPATIAAARCIGPAGRVVGVDYAEGMLAVARRKVAASGVQGVSLVQGDITALPYGAEFDSVICVLGIFFLDDMAAGARALWSHVRPGGSLAITTFGTDVWEPMLGRFVETARQARPGIELVVPWQRTGAPGVLARLLQGAGIADVQMAEDVDDVPFLPEEWYSIVMGSGLRRIAVDLGERRDDVLQACVQWARERQIATVRVRSTCATAVKAGA
jgi:ubiquinone/menaquinone biosynthesis C-methylase UbiE